MEAPTGKQQEQIRIGSRSSRNRNVLHIITLVSGSTSTPLAMERDAGKSKVSQLS